KGCSVASDTIKAIVGDNDAMAMDNIIIISADAGDISFASAIPSSLALKGSGTPDLPTVSEVQFQLKDTAGKPLQGKRVRFSPSTTLGGISLTNDVATTDANGIARTFLSAGTVKTTVRVKAWLEGDEDISAMSTTIALGTGAPTQNSMSLSIETLNPRALNYDGDTTNITIRVSDINNNPIAEGTTIAFFTSAGQIDRECVYSAEDGGCTVTWRGQNPRPDSSLRGLVVVMATLKGEETTGFDANGNGLFDIAEGYTPLPEAFLDVNNNSIW